VDFALQAHMIFINSVYHYIGFSYSKYRKLYLTKLLENWKEILTQFLPGNSEEVGVSKIQLFNGHGENLAALVLELHDDQFLTKILDLYDELKEEASGVNSQIQLDLFSAKVSAELAAANINYSSSLILEVLSDEHGESFFYYFFLFNNIYFYSINYLFLI
jgi:hypothetical protein